MISKIFNASGFFLTLFTCSIANSASASNAISVVAGSATSIPIASYSSESNFLIIGQYLGGVNIYPAPSTISYNLNVANAGEYFINLNATAWVNAAGVTVSLNGKTLGPISIPNDNGAGYVAFQPTTPFPINLPKGANTLTFTTLPAGNFNIQTISLQPAAFVSSTAKTAIPITTFDSQSNFLIRGPSYLGGVTPGATVSYGVNVANAGQYFIDLSATAWVDNTGVTVNLNGQSVGQIAIPNNHGAGYLAFRQTVPFPIQLPPGPSLITFTTLPARNFNIQTIGLLPGNLDTEIGTGSAITIPITSYQSQSNFLIRGPSYLGGVQANATISYPLYVSNASDYFLNLNATSWVPTGSGVAVSLNGTPLGQISIPYNNGTGYTTFTSTVPFPITLPQGHHVLTLTTLPAGNFNIQTISLQPNLFWKASGVAHPRILWTQNPAALTSFINTKLKSPSGSLIPSYYHQIISIADSVVSGTATAIVDPRVGVSPPPTQIISVARAAVEEITALGVAYRITGQKKYADAATSVLLTLSKFSDWNPQHFLDVAELTYAVAVGYDWFHEYLSVNQRSSILNALYTSGLEAYYTQYGQSTTGWTSGNTNWNFVCNSALLAATLAVRGEGTTAQEATLKDLQKKAIESLMAEIPEVGNDGGFPEGTMYWGYANRYFTMLLSAMESASGTDMGFASLSNIKNTPYFIVNSMFAPYANGRVGAGDCLHVASYGDADMTMGNQSALFYYAQKYLDPKVYKIATRLVAQSADGKGLLQGEGCYTGLPVFASLSFLFEAQAEQKNLPLATMTMPTALDYAFVTPTGSASLSSSLTDPNGSWVTLKAGNVTGHGKLDLGAFTFSSSGIDWIIDPGADNYDLPGYFSNGLKAQRWTYFRNSTLGQSTLAFCTGSNCATHATEDTVTFCYGDTCTDSMIGTSDITNFNQNPLQIAALSAVNSIPQAGTIQANLSSVNANIPYWVRTFTLGENHSGAYRKSLMIYDHFRSTSANCTYIWSAQTFMKASVSADKQSVTLNDGKGNTAIVSLYGENPQPPSGAGFKVQTVSVTSKQKSSTGLSRILYTGSCGMLPASASRGLTITVTPQQ